MVISHCLLLLPGQQPWDNPTDPPPLLFGYLLSTEEKTGHHCCCKFLWTDKCSASPGSCCVVGTSFASSFKQLKVLECLFYFASRSLLSRWGTLTWHVITGGMLASTRALSRLFFMPQPLGSHWWAQPQPLQIQACQWLPMAFTSRVKLNIKSLMVGSLSSQVPFFLDWVA